MSEAKHTPGPWEVHLTGRRGTFFIEAARQHEADVALVDGQDGYTVSSANARLIEAAPDLLTITKKLLDAHASAPDCVAFSEACDEFIEEARAALSKASA